jgi:hypothetical protein
MRELTIMEILRPRTFFKSPALRTGTTEAITRIEYATTDDLPDGRPTVPGFAEDGIWWALVEPLPGSRRRWRGISFFNIDPGAAR